VRARLQSMPSPPSIEDAKRWALQAAKGLAIVHDCGVIQGDGKNEGVRSRLSY
jgi:hypothetical protein